MRKIFISGICGFVGSSLASFFYHKNYQVSGIDNLSRKGSYKNYLKLKYLLCEKKQYINENTYQRKNFS